jgi:hypothetical protein
MPDALLEVPLPVAVNEILVNTSLSTIRELKYQQLVHLSPGVHLPKELAYQISVGAKYMLHQPAQVDLIKKSWIDFNRRIRWRIEKMFDMDGEDPYDPDYDVSVPSTRMAPALPYYIELGLLKGRLFVYKTMARVPDAELLGHPHKAHQPQLGRLKEFLLDNEYIITGTDKNLGIAVSTREWIMEKSQDILNDANNYRRLDHYESINILNEKCFLMEQLAKHAKEHIDYLEGTVADFMRSKITLRGMPHHIPKFYGIPKIHKTPVKMRPIIPCHSAVMNPAAKYVSKKLKPLIKGGRHRHTRHQAFGVKIE